MPLVPFSKLVMLAVGSERFTTGVIILKLGDPNLPEAEERRQNIEIFHTVTPMI